MLTATSRKLFVNLPVENLDAAVAFFTKLGFRFDERFTDETATCMVLSDEAFAMLIVKDRFGGFTEKAVADATAQTEAIMGLSAESRAEVDQLVEAALAAGGRPSSEPTDHGFMYSRAFHDLDGHLWSFIWMDPTVLADDAQA